MIYVLTKQNEGDDKLCFIVDVLSFSSAVYDGEMKRIGCNISDL